MKRIGVGFIRVSTGAQADEDRASIPAQRGIIQQIATQRNIEVVEVYELADVSGAEVLYSPKYRAFLDRLKDPQISCIITREFSRIMRPDNYDDYGILQHFVNCKIVLELPNETLDVSSNRMARFMLGLRAGMAGLERGDIAERIASSKEVLRKKGYHPCGEHTLARGLGHTKEKGWYWDKAELEQVELLFRLFLGGCQTYEKLSKLTGISRTSIPVILGNPVYAGWMVYDEKKDLSEAGLIPPGHKRKGYRRKIDRAPDEVIRVPLPIRPIITEAEHRQILEITGNKRRHWSSARADSQPRFTYRSFVYCAACHSPLYTHSTGGKDFYHCKRKKPRYKQAHPEGCTNKYMSRHLLEPKLDDILVARLTDAAFLGRVIEAHWSARMQKPELGIDDLLEARFEALSAKRKRILEGFLDGNLSRLEKNERLHEVDVEIEALNTVRPAEPAPTFGREQVVDVVQTFSHWKLLCQQPRRAILERLVPEIFVHRYVVSGVSLRAGRNFDTHPKSAA